MRGDLVYEKLGEIDPELVAEALPDAVPLVTVESLFAAPEKKRPRPKRIFVVCACLILAALMLVGGGVVMSRSGLLAGIFPNTEPGTEEETDDPNAPYQGTVTITLFKEGETIVLEGNSFLEGLGTELKNLLNQVAMGEGKPDPDPYERYEYRLDIGGDEIWLDPHVGMFVRDRQAELCWELDAETAWAITTIIKRLKTGETDTLPEDAAPVCEFIYEKATRHRGDVFEVELRMNDSGDYKGSFELVRIYLYFEESQGVYVIREYDISMMCTYVFFIPDNAPLHDYKIIAEFESDNYGDVTVKSDEVVLTVAENAVLPTYTFDYDKESVATHVNYGDLLRYTVSMTHEGDDIYRFGYNTVVFPTATLRSESGETYLMSSIDVTEDGEQVRHLGNGTVKTTVELTVEDTMPMGKYDLILAFEGHEQVHEDIFEVTGSKVLHRGASYGLTMEDEGSQFLFRAVDGSGYEIPFEWNIGCFVAYIPDNAPAGVYQLIRIDGNNDSQVKGDFMITDSTPQYRLSSSMKQQTAKPGDQIKFYTYAYNMGQPLRVFLPYDSFTASAMLVSEDGSYTLDAIGAPDAREPINYTYATGDVNFQDYTFFLPADIPAGTYDLVLTCRGQTKTIENVLTVVSP